MRLTRLDETTWYKSSKLDGGEMWVKNITKRGILDEIEADREAHVEFLRRFVRAKSPNPPGDTREAAQVVADYLSSYNIPFETWSLKDDLPNIVTDFPCDFSLVQKPEKPSQLEERRLVMNGHMDVFPVSKDEKDSWHRDPWSGDSDGKYVYGRGVVDMKAGTAASIIAYRYLYQLHQKLEQHRLATSSTSQTQSQHSTLGSISSLSPSLGLTVVSDEETGSKFGAKWLLSDEANGGGGTRWKGTVMINAEPGGLQSIRFGEKGTLRLTFHIHTISAHGAYLNLSEGAIRISARLINSLLSIENLPFLTPPYKSEFKKIIKHMKKPEVKKIVDEIMGEGASGILMKPTVNIGVIEGGAKVNVIPGECRFEVDIRIPIGMTRNDILHHINTTILPHFPEAKLEIQKAASNPPNFCSMEHPVVNLLKSNAVFVGKNKGNAEFDGNDGIDGGAKVGEKEKETSGGNEGLTGFTPIEIPGIGATDCKFWRYAGIPAYTYGPSPKTMGGRDERVEIEEFMDVLKTHVLTAWEFLGGGETSE